MNTPTKLQQLARHRNWTRAQVKGMKTIASNIINGRGPRMPFSPRRINPLKAGDIIIPLMKALDDFGLFIDETWMEARQEEWKRKHKEYRKEHQDEVL